MPTARPRRFDLIVFDWDGTLYDSTALIGRCIQRACADLGLAVPTDADATHVIGLGLVEALQHVAPDLDPARYPELGQRYRTHYFASQHELTLFPGTVNMLQSLRQRHHWLGVATGKSRRGLDEALSHVALRGLFDDTRTADETASKPHPRMLLELIQRFGVEPERTLMIGDTTHDLQLAANAGAQAVAVGFGAHPATQLTPWSPLHLARDTEDLAAWLQDHA